MLLARLMIVLLVAGACVAPAAADPPSITSYFAGTWSCSTALGSLSVKAYGLINNGQALQLANPYVTATSAFGMFIETYTQAGTGIAVSQTSGPFKYTATSSGWAGDTLAFVGQVVNGTQTTQQRETYQRADANHFARTFEVAEKADGPWTVSSHETCTRITPAASTATVTTPSALQALAARIGGPGKIFVGTLPDGWRAAAPLPAGATLFGSVQRGAATEVYYDLGTTTIADYAAALEKAGWTPSPFMAALPGGFAATPAVPTILCGTAGQPAVAISTPAGPDRSFSVTVTASNPLCNSGGPLGILASLRGPVPPIVAPAGATMTGSPLPFRFGASAAKLVSRAPLSALLDAFTAQMVAAKWQRLDSSAGPRTGSASFSFTDEHGTPWEAVIAIYAAPGASGTYYTVFDSTNLNGERFPTGLTSGPLPIPQ